MSELSAALFAKLISHKSNFLSLLKFPDNFKILLTPKSVKLYNGNVIANIFSRVDSTPDAAFNIIFPDEFARLAPAQQAEIHQLLLKLGKLYRFVSSFHIFFSFNYCFLSPFTVTKMFPDESFDETLIGTQSFSGILSK